MCSTMRVGSYGYWQSFVCISHLLACVFWPQLQMCSPRCCSVQGEPGSLHQGHGSTKEVHSPAPKCWIGPDLCWPEASCSGTLYKLRPPPLSCRPLWLEKDSFGSTSTVALSLPQTTKYIWLGSNAERFNYLFGGFKFVKPWVYLTISC